MVDDCRGERAAKVAVLGFEQTEDCEVVTHGYQDREDREMFARKAERGYDYFLGGLEHRRPGREKPRRSLPSGDVIYARQCQFPCVQDVFFDCR